MYLKEQLALMALSLEPKYILSQDVEGHSVPYELRALAANYSDADLSPRLHRFFTASSTCYARDRRYHFLLTAHLKAANSLYPCVPLAPPYLVNNIGRSLDKARRAVMHCGLSKEDEGLRLYLRDLSSAIYNARQYKTQHYVLRMFQETESLHRLFLRRDVTPLPMDYMLEPWLNIQ